MTTLNQPVTEESMPRSIRASATLVAAAALMGLAATASVVGAADRADRTAVGIARSITDSGTALIASSHAVGWTAAALVVFLWIGRRVPRVVVHIRRAPRLVDRSDPGIRSSLHRRAAVSFRRGGRYGP